MLHTILNFIANGCILVCGGMFYIMLFSNIGKGYKAIEKVPAMEHWLVKVALAFTATGALLNMVTLSTPSFPEIIMNLGTGVLFVWAVKFHGKRFNVLKHDRRRISDNK